MKAKPERTSPASMVSPSINIISEGTEIQGEVNSNGDIRIDGKLTGIVNSKEKVVVGSPGKVDGDINCQSADILGYVSGTVKATEILYLKSSARIEGDITAAKLVIESGAVFNGNCQMIGKETEKRPGKVEPKVEQAKQTEDKQDEKESADVTWVSKNN